MRTMIRRAQMPVVAATALVLALHALTLVTPAGAAQPTPLGRLFEAFAGSLAPVPVRLERNGRIYVPTYSTLPVDHGGKTVGFSVSLSIRNPSPTRVLAVRRISYFDTAGDLLEDYRSEPVGIRPFGTVNLFIPIADRRGGSGGNFLVEWASEAGSPELLVEAVMLGDLNGAGFSFVSRGMEIGPPVKR